ncbi:hypothetical protein [Bradyrhizobium sp. SZCCHNS1054]|uniref:hypothetical protein n=1 Tax=Bradyrhizobium sp. SZCCHNS1054 TaxID=3057301 RepID=UPI002916DC03|nr:hypothetical protein [Bradyrhizobium sp. SZCCHNS1054]
MSTFLASLGEFPAGISYDLHVIFKGFPSRATVDEAKILFSKVTINPIEVDDVGFDIGAYLKAARLVENRRLMFLNTFSAVLSADWLRYFSEALDQTGVGVVGATGSWQARVTGYELRALHILRRLRRICISAGPDHHSPTSLLPRRATKPRDLLRLSFSPLSYIYHFYHYPRHPNPHIRTNAFLIDRDLFLSLEFPRFVKKEDAYRFESGRRSMTNQIIARGLRPVVVGKDGAVFDIEDWNTSSTFWVDHQKNLLISDNRTRDYLEGAPEFRTLLENMAWHHPRFWRHV